MIPSADPVAERYELLWRRSIPLLREGRVDIDPTLQSGVSDARRGFTLIARPDAETQARILTLLEALEKIDPHQYYYEPDDLHLTILSLFTATADYGPFAERLDSYREVVERASHGTRPFNVEFRGVTATTGAVMIQGFPQDSFLENLRARLRSSLTARKLGSSLDERYRLVTAHMTAARFRCPLARCNDFADELSRHRETFFGSCRISGLSLVRNDWCVSRANLEILGRYPLSSGDHRM